MRLLRTGSASAPLVNCVLVVMAPSKFALGSPAATQTSPGSQVPVDGLHASPSGQLTDSVFWQPDPVLQLSVVQALPSSQFVAGPPLQLPLEQVSWLVQALPSLHGFEFGVLLQPLLVEQESVVQGLPSPQLTGDPPQLPPLH